MVANPFASERECAPTLGALPQASSFEPLGAAKDDAAHSSDVPSILQTFSKDFGIYSRFAGGNDTTVDDKDFAALYQLLADRGVSVVMGPIAFIGIPANVRIASGCW